MLKLPYSIIFSFVSYFFYLHPCLTNKNTSPQALNFFVLFCGGMIWGGGGLSWVRTHKSKAPESRQDTREEALLHVITTLLHVCVHCVKTRARESIRA